MPYPLKQQRAIFLDMRRRQGEAAARAFARKHAQSKSGTSRNSYTSRSRRAAR